MHVRIVLLLRPEMTDQLCRHIEKQLHTTCCFAHDVRVEKTITMRVTNAELSKEKLQAMLETICLELAKGAAVESYTITVSDGNSPTH